MTPLGLRRIAVEKLIAHLTGMLIVMVIVAVTAWMAGALFGTLPGDEIPPLNAIGFALWVGLVALASGAVAFALAPFVGRGAAAGIAGAVLIGGYFLNGYQATVPAFAGLANLTWFGWTVHHQPLIGQPDWLSLGLVALVTIVLFAIGSRPSRGATWGRRAASRGRRSRRRPSASADRRAGRSASACRWPWPGGSASARSRS